MLQFDHVSLRRGSRQLFADASFVIHPGQRVGITGANGSGKSSLLALIRGELHADSGDVSLPASWTIAHVAQETRAGSQPALDYVLDGDAEMRSLEQALAAAESANDGHRQADLHARLDAIGAYTAPSRAARILHGLGFNSDQEQLPVQAFSGGWRMRLNLAQVLMCRSDLLLLDEPTNHLDLDAVLWLEDYLRAYPGTLLLISHDRDFLDSVAERIVHIEQGSIRQYKGNYSDFERQRTEQLAQQQAAYVKQQHELAHMRRFIDRFRAKATKARQAQSRLKALERMEQIAPAHVDTPFGFEFPAPQKLPQPLLRIDQADAGYDNRPVLQGIDLGLIPGDRIGLLGHNGAGKSTLVKLLAGELTPMSGDRIAPTDLKVGYFAQHQLEQLRPDESPLQHLQRLDRGAAERGLRSFLGGFGFQGDMALAPVAPFSGGEKARLVLAMLVYQAPNLLLLDEPTNHLDLDMRHALNVALQDYAGALVVVSHDRFLLRSVADQFLLVARGSVQPFDGDLDDYRKWMERDAQADAVRPGATVPSNDAASQKLRRRLEAEQRQRIAPLKKRVQELEAALVELHEKKSVLETQLADPELYNEAQRDRWHQVMQARTDLLRKLERTESDWLEAADALEGAQQPSP